MVMVERLDVVVVGEPIIVSTFIPGERYGLLVEGGGKGVKDPAVVLPKEGEYKLVVGGISVLV